MQRYGLWRVTTEGDVEGRSTNTLGEFKGNFDEIAFYLADRCYYTLDFKLIDDSPRADLKPSGVAVNVRVDDGTSSPYRETSEEQAQRLRAVLQDTEVAVKSGTAYHGVQLQISRDDAKMTILRAGIDRENAMKSIKSKLTKDELRILGIK
jgi:hypothetical protein